MSNLKKGDIIEGQITGITKYGIFVSLEDNYTGLIHISEVSNKYINDLNELFKIGNIIKVKVLDIDYDKLQVKLSIKKLLPLGDKRKMCIIESKNGFGSLEEKIPLWINDKKDIWQK